MARRPNDPWLPVFLDPLFLAAGVGGSALVLLSTALAPLSVQLGLVGVIASLALGVLVSRSRPEFPVSADAGVLGLLLSIAKDEEMLSLHDRIAKALAQVAGDQDPLFHAQAVKRLAALTDRAEHLAQRTLVFEDTETWRVVYEQLLRSPGLHLYRSVALIGSPAYWRDEPGRQSMKLNFELQDSGRLSIERTLIIADELWPANEDLPAESLRQWIDEQHNHGIWLRLIRRCAVLGEPELVTDFGIYGSRAVGTQELSLGSHTVRFVLSFDFDKVREAEDRWHRLSVYGLSYRELLERSEFDI